ncbi:formate dehydrogenase accessory sulfurtransferase FdhD [Motiliproteus sediminis]|uniref:formate dehydrogenase accessory sulfurtransferase FdhD n=1 Tax=Motiliproteus sediminis TaxID=1468178 RepID=UPI001FE934F7|nr:formate dehydrogenase accessory sulfurtransferase FdhD [Motiliproteus sediminis]
MAKDLPLMSDAALTNIHRVTALDEFGQPRETQIAGESALTIYLDKREIVTLMTLGVRPEKLVLGYLWNQGFIHSLEQVKAIQVDWEVNAAAVVTNGIDADIDDKLAHRTVTTGCGQGTVFGDLMERIEAVRLPEIRLHQSDLYTLLGNLGQQNEVYRTAGAVHGCALCRGTEVISFVEDVGRHNAVDTLAGEMLLQGLRGEELIFYTTGRLTSEMVIKVTQMGIPTLLSRSGLTEMGLDLARRVGLTLIGRAKGRHFLVFNQGERIIFDQQPEPRGEHRHGR